MDYELTQIVGRIGSEPSMRYTLGGTAICAFSVAVGQGRDDSGQDRPAKWFRVSVFGLLGETCANNLQKGQEVLVSGRIEAHAYLNRDAKAAATLELTAKEVRFGARSAAAQNATQSAYNDFAPPPEDAGDIPF